MASASGVRLHCTASRALHPPVPPSREKDFAILQGDSQGIRDAAVPQLSLCAESIDGHWTHAQYRRSFPDRKERRW